jgi:hypothetical protein
MNMRRLGVLMAVLAIPVAGFVFIQCGGPAAAVRIAVRALALAGPSPAMAEVKTIVFETALPESVAALEARSGAGHRPHVKVTVSADEPEAPDSASVTGQVVRSGDMTRVGDDIHVGQDEVVDGSVTTFKGDVVVDGTVHGDVVAVLGDIFLNATARVDGDVVCIGAELNEEPGAYVSGERVTWKGGNLEAGLPHARRRDRESDTEEGGHRPGERLGEAFGWFLWAVGLTLLAAWILRRRIAAGAEMMRLQPAASLGAGALVWLSIFGMAVLGFLLLITIIGWVLLPLWALAIIIFYPVFAVLGLTVGAMVTGERLASRRGTTRMLVWQSALLGVLVLEGLWFLGQLLGLAGGFGLHALGGLLTFAATMAILILGTMGGGAWLRWEFGEGLFGQWRSRRPGGNGGSAMPPATAAPVSAPPAPSTAEPSGPEPGPGPAPGA